MLSGYILLGFKGFCGFTGDAEGEFAPVVGIVSDFN
jgi:hypothetical protein